MSFDQEPVMRDADSYDTDEEEDSSDTELLLDGSQSVHKHVKFTDPDDMSSSVNAPPDRYHMIYMIFIIQGIGMLLPWNFFITAKEYFEYKFYNDISVKQKFENAFALSAMFPNVISLSINIFLTNRLSRSCRISTCLFAMFSMFVITTIFVKINTFDWTEKFFIITIVCVVVMNTAAGVYQGTLFGVAGIIGQTYTQAIMSGQGLAGIFAAVADLFFKLVNPNPIDHTSSALGYFSTASVVIFITALTYSVLFKFPRMQFYFNRFTRHSKKDQQSNVQLIDSKEIKVPYILILKQIMPLAISVFIVFCVTLSLFPAVLAKIESVDKFNKSRVTNDLFSNLICFLLFNVGDLAGRIVAGSFQIVKVKGLMLPILCFSRIIFIPLFLMCNFSNGSPLPYVFKHDSWPIIFNCFFAISNGYLGSLCMMYAPRQVALEYSEIAGTIMSFFLTAGLTAGACLSFAFNV